MVSTGSRASSIERTPTLDWNLLIDLGEQAVRGRAALRRIAALMEILDLQIPETLAKHAKAHRGESLLYLGERRIHGAHGTRLPRWAVLDNIGAAALARGDRPLMISNAIIRQYAVGQQVDVEVAGQDVVLHYALALLNEAGLIGRDAHDTPGPLLFKGGTALRKCVFGSTGRFSQDIDLDATHKNGFEAQIEAELAQRSPYHEIIFQIAAFRYSQEDNFSGTIAYEHPHGNGAFELQISYRLDPVLNPRDLTLAQQPYFPRVECGIPDPLRLGPLRDDRREDHGLQPPPRRLSQGYLRPLPLGRQTLLRPTRAPSRRAGGMDRPTRQSSL